MRQTNKDMLIGLIASLDDKECGEILTIISHGEYKKDCFLHFDNVKLTDKQYNKLIYLWGENKTKSCISLLSEWLTNKGDRITKNISHYRQLIGWVERKYYQLNPVDDKLINNYIEIDTIAKAKMYIRKIPKELRAWDSEVRYLVNRYNIDLNKVK